MATCSSICPYHRPCADDGWAAGEKRGAGGGEVLGEAAGGEVRGDHRRGGRRRSIAGEGEGEVSDGVEVSRGRARAAPWG